jgi:hypothetical protein
VSFDASVEASDFFLLDPGKILILLWLCESDAPSGVQNLDSTGLVAKIFRNKGLDTPSGSLCGEGELAPDGFGSVCTVPLWAFHILSQEGCGKGEVG